ncbi:hypothetical protein HPB47_005302 [Ixodes persulcatus]|uniref:Uncharacterized protein n=1 Tax=Ixodes persulcatus TaxID=34615 RepID=A0AC60PDE7_IXOPE|nr:hypothetical protein HPB47_005302 [Ixodes persulcatus]
MSEAKREQWSCQLCRTSVNESAGEILEADSQTKSASFLAQLAEVNKKMDLLLSLKRSVDSLVQLPAKVDELLSLKSAVHTMERSIDDVVKSMDFFSKQYDSLLKHVRYVSVSTTRGPRRKNVEEMYTRFRKLFLHNVARNTALRPLRTDNVTASSDLPNHLEQMSVTVVKGLLWGMDAMTIERVDTWETRRAGHYAITDFHGAKWLAERGELFESAVEKAMDIGPFYEHGPFRRALRKMISDGIRLPDISGAKL